MQYSAAPLDRHSFPTRRSSDLSTAGWGSSSQYIRRIWSRQPPVGVSQMCWMVPEPTHLADTNGRLARPDRSEEHTSELQSLRHLVCRLLLEKKKKKTRPT